MVELHQSRLHLRCQRVLGSVFAVLNRLLFPTPPGRALHRRLRDQLETTTLDVPVEGWEEGPPLEIVFLSDLHAGAFMTAGDLAALARRVRALSPDLVVLGGDLVDTRWDELLLFEDALGQLEPPHGVVAVPGNHEYLRRGHAEQWTAFLERRGVEVLTNRGKRIAHGGRKLWLGGVDDLTGGRPDVDAALAGRAPGEPAVLLSHHPDVFADAAERDVVLQLSGHTHGGQLKLFGWTPLRHSANGWMEGRHGVNGSTLYVSRGVGTTVLPLRLGVPAEIVRVRLGGLSAPAPRR